MKRREEQELDRLLAQGRLSGPDAERIGEQVIASTRQEESAGSSGMRLWALSLGLLGAVAALAILWLALPHLQGGPGEFRSKGAGSGILLEAGCRHGATFSEERCQHGDTLLLRLSNLPGRVFLAAFASGPAGLRIWYFPTEQEKTPEIAPAAEPRLLDRAIEIGPEHVPGAYRLQILLFSAPVDRSSLARTTPLAIFTRSFHVVP